MSRYRKLPTGHPAVALLTPSRGSQNHTAYTSGVLNSFGVYGCWVPLVGQSDIYVARNVLANWFHAESGMDSMVFIDSDIGFEREDLQRLLAHPEPIVAGVYPGRAQISADLCRNADRTIPNIDQIRAVELFPVRLAPTGFMKIDRIVFDTIVSRGLTPSYGKGTKHHFFQSAIIDDELASEDFAFCELVNAAGFQIFADGRINLNHDGYIFPRYTKGLPHEPANDLHTDVQTP